MTRNVHQPITSLLGRIVNSMLVSIGIVVACSISYASPNSALDGLEHALESLNVNHQKAAIDDQRREAQEKAATRNLKQQDKERHRILERQQRQEIERIAKELEQALKTINKHHFGGAMERANAESIELPNGLRLQRDWRNRVVVAKTIYKDERIPGVGRSKQPSEITSPSRHLPFLSARSLRKFIRQNPGIEHVTIDGKTTRIPLATQLAWAVGTVRPMQLRFDLWYRHRQDRTNTRSTMHK